ncbi:MAG: DUF4984 domain-containing protein [Bacteroidales bacterium]
MKKNKFYPLSLLFFLCAALTSCNEEKVLYGGNEYVMFADTLYYMPVTPDAEKTFDVVVSTTKKDNKDRTYGVELVVNKSNAIEGRHFELLTNNVTIKAGELTGVVPVKGHYDHIAYGDSLALTLRLLTPKNESWDMYGKETNVSLIKCIPFSIDDFTGNLKFYASFPFDQSVISFYVKSEKLNDSTLIIKEAFSSKYDLKVRFKDNKVNPLETSLSVAEQVVFADAGVGRVYASTVDTKPSFYSSHMRSLYMYLDMFVPEVGTFGVYQYMFKWVPQSEVDAANNSTNTPFMMKNAAFDLKKSND